jgi:hypothetical protein
MAIQLDDPEATPEMNALQLRYQRIIGEAMIKELRAHKAGATLAMINALGHHLVLSIRSLNDAGHFKPGAIARILERLKLAATEN